MNYKESSYPNLYRDFRHIRQNDVYEIIRFYNKYREALSKLSTSQRFTILCYYANALFFAEEFETYVKVASEVLETSILENIQFVDGRDIYLHSLEQLGLAYMKLKNHDKAQQIAKQLWNISPDSKKQLHLIRKILKKECPTWVLKAKAVFLIAVLGLIILEVLHIIVMLPFFKNLCHTLVQIQYIALFAALGSGLTAFLGHYIYVGHRIRKFRHRRIS